MSAVHVIVVNWNGRDATLQCLDLLARSEGPPLVVHVIDNGSEDDSVARIRAAHPEALLQLFPENRGFAAAANAGMRAALDAGAELVFLLNNDARVEPYTIARLAEAAARRPECGLYGGKIYADRAAGVLWCCGVRLGGWPNLGRLRGHGRRDRGEYDREEVVDSLTGCGLLVRREVLERVGLFDEAFWVYVEDADLCVRAREHGFACLYVPGATMEHRGAGSTGGGYSPARKYLTGYGSALFVRKHGRRRPGLVLGFLLLDVLTLPLLLAKGLLDGTYRAAWAKARGTLDGLAGRPLDRGVVERRRPPGA